MKKPILILVELLLVLVIQDCSSPGREAQQKSTEPKAPIAQPETKTHRRLERTPDVDNASAQNKPPRLSTLLDSPLQQATPIGPPPIAISLHVPTPESQPTDEIVLPVSSKPPAENMFAPTPESLKLAARQIIIPAGTPLKVVLAESIDTDRDRVGQSFRATLSVPVFVDGQSLLPKYSEIYLRLIDSQTAGKVKGSSELKLQPDRVIVAKQSYSVVSNTYTLSSESQGLKTALNPSIGAGVGAVIGGIFAGGKGAAIGAGAGAGGGVVLSRPNRFRTESEIAMEFRLEAPLTILKADLYVREGEQ